MKVCVIGLGEVGIETFKGFHGMKSMWSKGKPIENIIGVDINKDLVYDLKNKNPSLADDMMTVIPDDKFEHYIICVYTTSQVFSVLKNLEERGKLKTNPLITIESTVAPGTYNNLKHMYNKLNIDLDIVLFPHRFNPNDPDHKVFNLNRVVGRETELEVKKFVGLYHRFFEKHCGTDNSMLHFVSPGIAELCKPMENTYRYMEIVLAQEMKRMCDKKGIDFTALKLAMNTKWNIDVKEARDGVAGKCLPKDMDLCIDFFDSHFLKIMSGSNEIYKENI